MLKHLQRRIAEETVAAIHPIGLTRSHQGAGQLYEFLTGADAVLDPDAGHVSAVAALVAKGALGRIANFIVEVMVPLGVGALEVLVLGEMRVRLIDAGVDHGPADVLA
jgi:hypothetical protein